MKYFAYTYLSLLSILIWVVIFFNFPDSIFGILFILLIVFELAMRYLKLKLNFWFMIAFGANAIIALIFILINALI
ncbi:hypothetical protein [Lactococcus cremoris]|uniref:Uncharacterized protein n=1 Tax=Lactococcus lactis subsp. cremoris TaxID=1359 RepID=A0AAX4AKK0_LACLC|nr:hypothetical protein [Lactococcus cremoris]KGH33459.1 hypothetical protein JL36_08245 [Lactococcus cremoris]QSE63750.1 hypothetical protein JWR96_01005 [Lactococcus cremoris]WMX71647.1 hypothetical protein RF668_05135 [Lactococcus cremoris]